MQYNVTVIGSGPGGYIVDGRESVSFLVRVKELLEDPGRLILGV